MLGGACLFRDRVTAVWWMIEVEESIDSSLLKVVIPPFSFQPLVENAIQHGLHSSPSAGRLHIVVCETGPRLEMSVSDDDKGVPFAKIEQLFFAERTRAHALGLLRRRLQGLYGRSFQLNVRSARRNPKIALKRRTWRPGELASLAP